MMRSQAILAGTFEACQAACRRNTNVLKALGSSVTRGAHPADSLGSCSTLAGSSRASSESSSRSSSVPSRRRVRRPARSPRLGRFPGRRCRPPCLRTSRSRARRGRAWSCRGLCSRPTRRADGARFSGRAVPARRRGSRRRLRLQRSGALRVRAPPGRRAAHGRGAVSARASRARRSTCRRETCSSSRRIGPGATHVGIALGPSGPGEFVHAPGDGGAVRVEHFDSPYWRARSLA